MENTDVAPINHGVVSATSSVAAGAAGGFVKTGLKGYGFTAIACTVLGALVGGAIVAGFSISAPIWIGAAIGALLGFGPVGMGVGGISSAFGAFKGGNHAVNQVKLEKGAANVMQAQVDAYKAQAYVAAANDNRYNFPEQGSPMNQAGTTVNVVQADGRLNGQQLQRA